MVSLYELLLDRDHGAQVEMPGDGDMLNFK